MDWNSYLKVALREAKLKKELVHARMDMFYQSQDELGVYQEHAFRYLIDCINDWADQYEEDNESEQAEMLRSFVKEFRSEHNDKEYDEWALSEKICSFFDKEFDFYRLLIEKYNRLLGVGKSYKSKDRQQYFPIYHEKHGWAENWYLM